MPLPTAHAAGQTILATDINAIALAVNNLLAATGNSGGVIVPADLGFEADTSGWTPSSNTLLTRVTTPVQTGAGSAQLLSIAAGDLSIYSDVAVTAGVTYDLSAYFATSGTGRMSDVTLSFLNAGGTVLGTPVISSSDVSSTAFSQRTVTATAPTGAVAARRTLTVRGTGGAGATHYADTVTFGVSTRPLAPTLSPLTVLSTTSLRLNWNAAAVPTGAPAVTGYRVYSSDGTLVSTVGNVVTATLTGLTPGTTYSYYVKAFNSSAEGAASAQQTGTTTAAAATAPSTPTAPAVSASDAAVFLTITPPATGGSAITGYDVQNVTTGTVTAVTNTQVTITGLTNGTAYTFKVRAKNAVGTSAYSAASTGVTPVASVPNYLNHVTIAAPRNGGATHTVSPSSGTVVDGTVFTPTAGRLLVCIADGAVTSTTPTGWDQATNGDAVGGTGLYLWTKTAAGGGNDAVATTHNASDYPVVFDFYEFAAGATLAAVAKATGVTNSGSPGPVLAGLTGTNWVAGVAGQVATNATVPTTSWDAGTTEVATSVAGATTAGYIYSLTYVQGSTDATAAFTWSSTATPSVERLIFAVNTSAAAPAGGGTTTGGGTPTGGGTGTLGADVAAVSNGYQITAANTGHTACYDPTLGRNVTDADLIVHTGLVSMSDFVPNNGVIAKHWFKGGLIADRNGVSMIACKFDGIISGYYSGVHHPFTVRWCTSDTPGAAGEQAIEYQDYTAYRCRFGGGSDGGKINGGLTMTECFVRNESQDAADHNDGLQAVGSYTGGTIERCNVDCRPVNGGGGVNGAIFIADGSSGLWHILDNYIAGGQGLFIAENASYDVQGNRFANGTFGNAPARRAFTADSKVTWGNLRPNVLVDAANTVLSTVALPANGN